ncbi:hypothetical protein NDU88_006269 [Pleurodeles waltl]|uniref:Uncharacterized protein n=1 Tax=Pleurodeles waltl TaxID=8319 RepID=A0AAV7VP81_PLEWA|nr:hypothetical protein NDU88_006269 [Pleurodeles waltl]
MGFGAPVSPLESTQAPAEGPEKGASVQRTPFKPLSLEDSSNQQRPRQHGGAQRAEMRGGLQNSGRPTGRKQEHVRTLRPCLTFDRTIQWARSWKGTEVIAGFARSAALLQSGSRDQGRR